MEINPNILVPQYLDAHRHHRTGLYLCILAKNKIKYHSVVKDIMCMHTAGVSINSEVLILN